MSTETLPYWFWIIYYMFIVVSVGVSIFAMYKKNHIVLSSINIFAVISFYFVGLIGNIGRPEGTELDFFKQNLAEGKFWAIYIVICVFFVLFWWFKFLTNKSN